MKKALLIIIVCLVLICCCCSSLTGLYLVFRPYRVTSQTSNSTELWITKPVSYKNSEALRGQMVVYLDSKGKNIYGRIIAVPGDDIQIADCKVHLHNPPMELEEPYLPLGTCTKGGTILKEDIVYSITPDHYIILSDNRSGVNDSRWIGSIPSANIKAELWFRVL